MILEGLSVLSFDAADKETLFSLLLVFSGTLTDIKGKMCWYAKASCIIYNIGSFDNSDLVTSNPWLLNLSMAFHFHFLHCLVTILSVCRTRICQ